MELPICVREVPYGARIDRNILREDVSIIDCAAVLLFWCRGGFWTELTEAHHRLF